MLSRFFVVASSAALFALVACSSSSTSSSGASGCNTDPWSCPSGQTCWPKDPNGNFACLNSASGVQKGASCQNLPGTASCGDEMFCLQQTVYGGTCVTYCDPSNPAHGCDSGEICTPVALQGTSSPQVHVCYGGGTTQDAGTQDSGGTGDAGGGDSAVGDAASD